MNKIIVELLKVKYPDVKVELLTEIIEATPNDVVATEILCGLYVEPKFEDMSVPRYNSGRLCTFVSFDKWRGKINYTNKYAKTRSAYFLKTTPKESITNQNFEIMKATDDTPKSDKIWLDIPTGEILDKTGSCDVQDWTDGYKKAEEAMRKLEEEADKIIGKK